MTEENKTHAGENPGQQLSELDALKAKLLVAEQQRDEYLALVKQTRADFENYQKRSLRDYATEKKYAQAPLAGDLLPGLDNLERAVAAAKQAGDNSALTQGVGMVINQFLDVLRRHGVTRMDVEGQAFDPNKHQAVMQQPSTTHPPQTVLQVLEHGYMHHERVLRPASVIVTMASSSE